MLASSTYDLSLYLLHVYHDDVLLSALRLSKDRASGRLNYWRPGAGRRDGSSHSLPMRDQPDARGHKTSVLTGDYQLLAEVVTKAVEDAVAPLTDQVSKLRTRVQRPDLVKYSVEEAAKRLGRSRSGLYQLIKEGEIVPVKERGRTYLTEEEIQRWERSQRR